MTKYIYPLFCYTNSHTTGIRKNLSIFANSIDEAKQKIITAYQNNQLKDIHQYTHYDIMYPYEYVQTDQVDSRNRPIFAPKYPYDNTSFIDVINVFNPMIVEDDIEITSPKYF
jgi:hypothetical protein